MLRSASRSILASLLVIAGAWTGCVGEDPAINGGGERGVGERLGPCYPDGTCEEGLVCRDGEICLTPDEPKPSGTDGGGTARDGASDDGGSDDDAGGADGAPGCRIVASGAGPMCNNEASCGEKEVCCKSDPGAPPTCIQRPACPEAVPSWDCETTAHCGSGICCFVGQLGSGSVCDFVLNEATSVCVSSASDCLAVYGGRPACTSASDCSSTCSSVRAQTKLGFTVDVKACPQ